MRPVTGNITRRANSLKTTTIREFNGGWNVIDSQLSLSSKFSVRLRNMYRAADGSLKVRFGTKLFKDLIAELGADVVNQFYYNGFIIAIGVNGQITATLGTGATYRIWDEEIAGTRNGSPIGWGVTDFVSFTPFKSDLQIHNGVDKPLLITNDMRVDYLQDLASLSNGNTPIGRYACTHGEYVIIAGDPLAPSTIHISNKGAGGTWFGDLNSDATDVDLAAYINAGTPIITGVASFRDKLIVTFDANIVIMTLGVYNNTGDHIPSIDDVIPEHGSISHRAIQALGDDMLFTDTVGVPSIKRALFTGTIQPDRPSQLVDPVIQKNLSPLSVSSLQDRVFSIYDKLAGQYVLFTSSADHYLDTVETRAFVYTLIDTLKVKAWSDFTEMNWRSACRSQDGRVFFSKGSELYVYGNDSNPLTADRIGAEETFSDDTCFNDQTGFTPVTDDSGIPIIFDWELPWADFKERENTKVTKYIGMDVQGNGRFTFEAYVDNIYSDRSDTGDTWTDDTLFTDGFGFSRWHDEPIRLPELSMDFIGGDALGYGYIFGEDYGGGRNTNSQRLYAFPTKGKIFKFRASGETRKPLRFVSLSVSYLSGSIRR